MTNQTANIDTYKTKLPMFKKIKTTTHNSPRNCNPIQSNGIVFKPLTPGDYKNHYQTSPRG